MFFNFIRNFLFVFFFGIIGFGIALMGLFSDGHVDFPNIKETIYTLFSAGLGILFCYIILY